VTVIQVWLLVGIPALTIALALYTARSRWLGAVGLLVLMAATVVLATADRASAAVMGVILTLLYAAGRAGGGAVGGDDPVHRPHTTDVIGAAGSYPRST
jgi:hypothetical protein